MLRFSDPLYSYQLKKDALTHGIGNVRVFIYSGNGQVDKSEGSQVPKMD
jgi:hypothetical protein